ncbi:accessory gene regulator ArgB-like protein [Acetivibrio ethanolgignens]|uniref:Accessory regulator AgrB n=1 Tax=Acetivibrio ethanolgignens TaxID=290052 RepID=A0A0V8QDF7_9FIRM|nr:accessory gene regulator B family protein [Acetivibrio ethanolgignens]KSV58594.1 hypothetical protein ASU35_12070 [Acetivibrio ethanolgignens]
MLERISIYLSTLLLQEKIITVDEKDTYKYGLEITMANIINGFIVLIIGVVLNLLVESILFYLVFVSLRFFCGGYHADSYTKCFFSFAFTTIVCLVISERLAQYEEIIQGLFFITAVMLGEHILKMAPIEHENRPLTEEEKNLFRKRSVQVLVFWIAIGIILWMGHLVQMETSLISAFIAVTILMRIGGIGYYEKRSASGVGKSS